MSPKNIISVTTIVIVILLSSLISCWLPLGLITGIVVVIWIYNYHYDLVDGIEAEINWMFGDKE